MSASTIDKPEQLMTQAAEGRLTKHALLSLLAPAARPAFLAACAKIELKYTEDCRALNDPCLDSGCSMEGDRCLQPLLRAGTEYDKACGAEWAKLFVDDANRATAWKAALSDYGAL